jgi:hypothetical protein
MKHTAVRILQESDDLTSGTDTSYMRAQSPSKVTFPNAAEAIGTSQ